MIPFSPPRIDKKTKDAVNDVLDSGWITTGPVTKRFEKDLAKFLNVEKLIALNSWTNAAELFLRWYGIKEGDEIIVPAYTYSASANIIFHLGATPVLVDSEKGGFNLCLRDLERKITPATKVIMPVDIGGYPCNYEKIQQIINEKANLFKPKNENEKSLKRILLFSDSAHSLGATLKGKPVSKWADVSCYSFHAVKNLTTAEGGALAFNLPQEFNGEEIYKELNIFSLHGQTKDALAKTVNGSWHYDIITAGYKCNLTDVHAAIGAVELGRYAETLQRRKDICNAYHTAFKDFSWYIAPPLINDQSETSYHLFQLRVAGINEDVRDAVIDKLKSYGVSTNVHFKPLPYFTFYKAQGFKISDYPNADETYQSEISLPVYFNLTEAQINTVTTSVIKAVNECVNA